jgi:ABC-type glycerol-3-phosphate transport system substrate-binding protein
MGNAKFRCLMAGVLSLVSFVNYCGAQATDPKVVEAAKKEGGEIEAYVTLRTDTAQYIWKMFEAKYPFLKVKQYKADSDKMLQRLATEYRAKKYLVDVLNFGGGFHTQVLIEHGIAGAYLSPETKYFAPAFKEINAEKILSLSIEEVQANFRKYLEEYRTYFGK